ncbi:MAG TPA: DUF4175 family protein [Pirellulales bacterium]|nr:DUF4175 family protein [Pirellulales bacterium]
MSTVRTSGFIRRFDQIWRQARRVQFWQASCWALLTVLAGIAALAAVDYACELSLTYRALAALGIVVGALGVAVYLAARALRRWQRNATASAIERVFPQLGQRIRTTVQFGELSEGQIEASGAAGSLVTALEDDTVRRAQPLPLDAVVPWKSLALASLLAAGVGLVLAGASAFDWQWRIAAQRALLGDEPYTRLTVTPGDTAVKEGESLDVEVVVEGRIGDTVSFATRRLDEEASEWREEILPASSGEDAGLRRLAFHVPLARLRHPFAYRVAAGSAASDIYHVRVRYPLKIAKMRAVIQPPAYTGLSESVVEDGDLTALVGSHVKLSVELDQQPASAYLEMEEMNRRRGEALPAERLTLAIDGKELSTEFEVTSDKTFSVVASSSDGMELADNKHRLRARQDEAPQVWFESPAEALEVHTLAEILMKVRASDDFGLSRAGIMFEVNNEEEYPLLAEDFAAAAQELQETGTLSPQTRTTLEKVLPLEHFALTQQDSVMYYAFAEDIRPNAPQRSETDLRFIDIRPFKRQYRLLDPDAAAGMNQGPQLKTLEELIARQRYALNRGIRLSRTFEHTGQADLAAVDALTKFEAELAKSTRELAEGLEARGVDETELLYQAEAAMLSATDSLSAGKYDTATLQMRDALKDLIEGRDRIRVAILKNPNRAQLAELRAFDRLQRQKLRRPKTDEEEARQIVERLEELADQEELVYASLGGSEAADSPENTGSSDDPSSQRQAASADPTAPGDSPSPEDKTGKPNEAKPDESKPDGAGSGENPADKPGRDEDAGNERMAGEHAKQELEDRQLDIAIEARELEKALAKLKNATDLAKERMAAAAKAAEEAAEALGQGKPDDAKRPAGDAQKTFRELVEQVAALLAKEQADRIAAAQQMAADLAQQQQDFRDRLANAGEAGGDGEPQPDRPPAPGTGRDQSADPSGSGSGGLGSAAERIADKAKTLSDVLAAAAKADDPEDQASAKKVEELVQKLALKALAERLAALPDQVRDGKLADAKTAVGDGAERMEAAAEQLGALRRAIVAPQVDQLANLEKDLAGLDDRLDELDTDPLVTGWHVDADTLLERIDEVGVDDDLRKDFIEEMRKNGWSPTRRGSWTWERTPGGYYVAPSRYRTLITRLSASLRARMQELMLGDLSAGGDEPIPPQYQELVDRYYRVLATERSEKSGPAN